MIASFSTRRLLLNGPVPGNPFNGYDYVKVTNSLSLSNATLAATLGYSPAVGDTFTILDNQTPGAIGGTIAGHPEGSYLKIGNADFQITYAGGSNHDDVVLTFIAPPTVTIGVGGSTSFCPPGSVMLTAMPAGGTGSYPSYQW